MFSLHIDTARDWRGGQNQVLLTVLGLRARGHRTVLMAHPQGELRRRAAEGLELVPLTTRGDMDLSAGWRLSRMLQELNPNIVHAHDPHAMAAAALALSLGTGRSSPPLVAARRVDFHVKKNAFSRWKHRQVDCFICASDAIRQVLVADGIRPSDTVTVYEGIDVERVAAASPVGLHAEFWLPTHAPIVGNVAALAPHKGQRYLVEAAPAILRAIPEARLIIVGQGDLENLLRRQIRDLHVEKHVILAGFRPDVLSLHNSFDLFVLSSVTEGLGTSLLDAMAAGRAVVATRVGGIPEIVLHERTGLLVPPRDPEALAAAIIRLLRNPSERSRMGEAGRARVRELFTADRMVDETLKVYARLLDADSPRPQPLP